MKLKKGDKVIVIAGKNKGKESVIIKALPRENKVILEGVNIKKMHKKATQHTKGGIIEAPAAVDVSNVALLDPKEKKPSRVGYTFDKKGKKVRVSKKSGTILK